MTSNSPIRPTTIIEAPALAERLGLASLTFASETFQVTGSFKFRAAYMLVSSIGEERVIAASSGNFGQALACACRMLGKSCIVVMPDISAAVKIEAVRSYGGEVDLIDTTVVSRTERVRELAREHPGAYVTNAYDDAHIIAGNATLGQELAGLDVDQFVAPIGGGGLSAGLILGLREGGSAAEVVGAEPLLANDAARSLRAGRLVANDTEPLTIADGARTLSLGHRNWAILQQGLSGIVEVPEERIADGVSDLFERVNLKAEPTGALALGAILSEPGRFDGKRVCCIVSGGNVDAALYARLITRAVK